MTAIAKDLWLSLRRAFETLGAMTLFLLNMIASIPAALMRFGLVSQQIFNAGALSLVIIMLCGLFIGMVLGLLGFDLAQRIGSEEALGAGAALALVKELGPVTTSLLFAGRAGTALVGRRQRVHQDVQQ